MLCSIGRSAGVFRFLWTFIPEPEIARDIRFEHLLASRFLSDAGQQAILFGALVSVARSGGSALEVALVGVAALLPPALLGLYGGAIADAIPRRVALAGRLRPAGDALLRLPRGGGDRPTCTCLRFSSRSTPWDRFRARRNQSVLPIVANDAQLASAAADDQPRLRGRHGLRDGRARADRCARRSASTSSSIWPA